MSSIRGIGDGFAFQRLLWLLVATVLAPTAILTVFGVTAIRNQSAAIQQELDRQQAQRLEVALREVLDVVDGVERAHREATSSCVAPCEPQVAGVAASWSWEVDERPPLALAGAPEERGERGAATWFTPADGSAPIAVFRDASWRRAWRLDVEWVESELNRRLAPVFPSGVSIALDGPQPGPATPIEEMMARLQEPAVADLVLGRPLDRWRLVIDDRGVPTRAVLRRNAWLYPVSLFLLVSLVLVGSFVTLGSATREIRLSRLQTDFVSSVSHDLRTPLTSIRMFVETLQSGRLDDDPQKIAECLDLLALETDRLSRMIERVLSWARMEAGRRIYEREPVEVEELVQRSLRALRAQTIHDAAGVDDIVVTLAPELPLVLVDRDAIVEALVNLLQNAVKYTPAPRKITVRAERHRAGVTVAVSDNGPGIAKSDRRRVFEKFYQADNLLSSPVQKGADRGSGLGLSIVRAVIRAHGGWVALESEVGRGSTFTLWLPERG